MELSVSRYKTSPSNGLFLEGQSAKLQRNDRFSLRSTQKSCAGLPAIGDPTSRHRSNGNFFLDKGKTLQTSPFQLQMGFVTPAKMTATCFYALTSLPNARTVGLELSSKNTNGSRSYFISIRSVPNAEINWRKTLMRSSTPLPLPAPRNRKCFEEPAELCPPCRNAATPSRHIPDCTRPLASI